MARCCMPSKTIAKPMTPVTYWMITVSQCYCEILTLSGINGFMPFLTIYEAEIRNNTKYLIGGGGGINCINYYCQHWLCLYCKNVWTSVSVFVIHKYIPVILHTFSCVVLCFGVRRKLVSFKVSIGTSDAICRYRSGSTLALAMACCLTAPNRYLNQCWLIISEVHLRAVSREIHWCEFENY